MKKFKPLPLSGTIVQSPDDYLAYPGVLSPSAAVNMAVKALALSTGKPNEFARPSSLDNRGTTGRPAAIVHLQADGTLVPPPPVDPKALPVGSSRAVHLARRRSTLVTQTNGVLVEAIRELHRCRCWDDGDWLQQDHAEQLADWAQGLKDCSRYIEVWSCPCCAATRTKSDCCACPPCSREQRRRTGQWVARAKRVYARYPNQRSRRWRLLTLSLRKTGNVEHDVEATIRMRAALMRLLRAKFGMEAAFGAIEQGEDSNVHLHALAYCDYVGRSVLQSWLRSRDCTVPGCKHPADDRCDACKAAKKTCFHADGTRVRCNGSWVVNVQAISGEKGVYEAIKYAAAPVALHDIPEPGKAATDTQLLFAMRLLRFYLVMRGRHRVETYGGAKDDSALAQDDDDLPLDGEMLPCPKGNVLEFVSFGVNQNGTYLWYRTQFGSA